uniref:Uncharacterized protein n=1 Tax=Romanomermis culicivorax TaxID=13658 RepID=A0A915K0F4_ROMCU
MFMVTIFGRQWFFVLSIFSLIRLTMAISSSDKFSESYNCCLNNQVPEHCAKNLCRPPDDWSTYQDEAAYYLPVSCNRHLEQIGRCLSNGRNNSACCSRSEDMLYTLCLHLCSGDAFAVNLSQSKNLEYGYSSCLIRYSKETVMQCTADGYAYIPTPPVNLRAVDVGSDYALVQWDPPTRLPHLVTSYVLHYRIVHESGNNDTTWRRAASTPDARYHLKNLTPDTSYAFHVVAETATAGNKSSDSPAATFTTKGNLPAVTVYNGEVRGELNSSTTLLICHVEVQGQKERAMRVEWYVRAGVHDDRIVEPNFRIINSKRFEAEFFPLQDLKQSASSKTYAAILRIKDLAKSDYGIYKCEVTNDYGTARG